MAMMASTLPWVAEHLKISEEALSENLTLTTVCHQYVTGTISSRSLYAKLKIEQERESA